MLLALPGLGVADVGPEGDHVVERAPAPDNAARVWRGCCRRLGRGRLGERGGDLRRGWGWKEGREEDVEPAPKEMEGRQDVRLHFVAGIREGCGGRARKSAVTRSVCIRPDGLVVHCQTLDRLKVGLALGRVLCERPLEIGVRAFRGGDAVLGKEVLEHADVLEPAVEALAVEGD